MTTNTSNSIRDDLGRRCAQLQSDLILAGLPRTAGKMTRVVWEVGYEIAEQFEPRLAKHHKKARVHEHHE